MGYFPFFIDIKDKKIIIAGGGTVALRKIEKLLAFEPEITVIAPQIHEKIAQIRGIEIIRRDFADDDLNGAFAAIGATDDEELNSRIAKLCGEKNILVNIVDDPEKCGFLFPALVKYDNVCAGISTEGKSPIFARFMREMIDDMLDEKMLETLKILSRFRPIIKRGFDTEKKRKSASEALLELCLADDELPSDEKISEMLERIGASYENQDRNEEKSSCAGTD